METSRAQLREARKLITELETTAAMSVASAKKDLHATLEAKDAELQNFHERVQGAEARARMSAPNRWRDCRKQVIGGRGS